MIVLEDQANLRLFEAFTNPPLTHEKNAVNSRIDCSNDYFGISLETLYYDTRQLDHFIGFCSYLYINNYLLYFTLRVPRLSHEFFNLSFTVVSSLIKLLSVVKMLLKDNINRFCFSV